MDLNSSPRLEGAHIEFTTKCNLKCSYCAVSQPDDVGRDIGLPTIDAVIADVVALRVPKVGISGKADRCRFQGCAISNLARKFRTIGGWSSLVVSI
jgi:hypothetical protein